MTLRSLVRAQECALGETDAPTLEALAEVCAARGEPAAAEAAYRAALRAVGRSEREMAASRTRRHADAEGDGGGGGGLGVAVDVGSERARLLRGLEEALAAQGRMAGAEAVSEALTILAQGTPEG